MKKQAKKVVPVQKGEPKFVYFSVCCNERATKTPCFAFGAKSKEAETQGLGSWRCGKCRKACKCTRTKNQEAKGE